MYFDWSVEGYNTYEMAYATRPLFIILERTFKTKWMELSDCISDMCGMEGIRIIFVD